MEFKAIVNFLGSLAHYRVRTEAKGVFAAHLEKYEGPDSVSPPEEVTLVRSVRHWSGSYSEQYFIDELGEEIEKRVRGGNPHEL